MRNSLLSFRFIAVLLTLGLNTLRASAQEANADSLKQRLSLKNLDTTDVNILLDVSEYYFYRPGDTKADLDSAYTYARNAETASSTLRFDKGYECSQLILSKILSKGRRGGELRALLQSSKNDKLRAGLLLELGRIYLGRDLKDKTYLDSAKDYFIQSLAIHEHSGNDKGAMETLMAIGGMYSDKSDPIQAAIYYEKAITYIENIKDPLQKARAWGTLAEYYTRSSTEMPHKIKAWENALTLYRQLGNKEQEAGTLKSIADMHGNQGNFSQALKELLEVLRIYKSIGYRNLHYTYDLLAYVHRSMGNYAYALPYGLDAIESAKATGDTTYIDNFRIRVGVIYSYWGRHEKALEVFLKVYAIQVEKRSDAIYAMSTYLIAIQEMLALNQPERALQFSREFIDNSPAESIYKEPEVAYALGDIHLALKNYSIAESHLLKASRLMDETADKWSSFFIADIKKKIAILYTETGQYQKASDYLRQAVALVEHYPDLKLESELYFQKFKLDSLQGNYSSAIEHYQKFKLLEDSLFNEQTSNQFIAHQVQYDTEKKEQNIALLTQQGKAQEAVISQRQTERNALIGGSVLLITLLGISYNGYRVKQRSNKKLQSQQNLLQLKNEELQLKQSELETKNIALQDQKKQLQQQQNKIHEANRDLERLLEDKERLLKEIHHRVKNNLQIVMSLLNSQASSLEDKLALSAIQDSQNRVQAMALIHQKLYQADGLARIQMRDYIEEVVAYLQDSYRLEQAVVFSLAIEPIELDVTLAVPLGLIINETITNALKYAFPNGRVGRIDVNLHGESPTSYNLTISDNGIGLPAGFNPSSSRSLGMKLINGFSSQLGGKITIQSNGGLKISLIFGEEQTMPMPDKPNLVYG